MLIFVKEDTLVPLSARNDLKGEITEVLLGRVTALITIKVGDNLLESVITKHSAERHESQEGRQGYSRNQGHRSHGPKGLA
jgi:molybdopterin-binding protein